MRRIHSALLIAATVSLLGCESPGTRSAEESAAATSPSVQMRCDALNGKQLGYGTVTEAKPVAKGEELISVPKRMMLKALLPFDLPPVPAQRDFCRVLAELKPVSGSLIKVQAWLPDDWNGKMLAKGGGGFNGGLFSASVAMQD